MASRTSIDGNIIWDMQLLNEIVFFCIVRGYCSCAVSTKSNKIAYPKQSFHHWKFSVAIESSPSIDEQKCNIEYLKINSKKAFIV